MNWIIIAMIAAGLSQGAAMYADKTQGLDQGAHQQSVAAAAPGGGGGVPTQIIGPVVTQWISDEVYAGSLAYA